MIEDYDNSNIPYPVKPIVKLDYCWRLTYTMFRHSFYLSIPMTMIYFIWNRTPQVWSYTRKTFPFRGLALNYITCVLLVNTINTVWSLGFEDYWYNISITV